MKKLFLIFILLFAGAAFAATEADLLKAANAGDAKAQFELGKGYLEGDFGNTNAVKAKEWLEKAAYQGHSEAQMELGNLMFLGSEGVKADKIKGCAWLYTTKEPAGDYLCILQTTQAEKDQAQKEAKQLQGKIKAPKK